MHIHPNSNLTLATLGVGREELHEVQAKRAAEVRRKLSSAPRIVSDTEETLGYPLRVEKRASEGERADEDSFGQFFSAKA